MTINNPFEKVMVAEALREQSQATLKEIQADYLEKALPFAGLTDILVGTNQTLKTDGVKIPISRVQKQSGDL